MNEKSLTVEQIKKIAVEYGRTKGPTDLAKELGVSKQRVQEIAFQLRKWGFPVPKIRLQKYATIIDELRVEHPELFSN